MSRDLSPPIAVEGLRVAYGRSWLSAGTAVLDGIDLRVEEGQVHALVGRNGAGKSSMVRCLLGQQKPAEGQALLFGENAWRHRARLVQRLGVVPEEPDAPPTMSARALGRFCSQLYPRWDQARFDGRLRRFDVPPATPFGRLSRGQKTQVMLALALAPDPELLVLDDPTLGLDPISRDALFEELVDVLAERGTTVLMTSHDLPGIERVATHLSYLDGQKLAVDEELEQLKGRYRRLVLAAEAGSPNDSLEAEIAAMEPVAEKTRGREREITVSRFDAERLAAWRGSRGADQAHAEPMSLEDILLTFGRRSNET